jgi:hypothetical protein
VQRQARFPPPSGQPGQPQRQHERLYLNHDVWRVAVASSGAAQTVGENRADLSSARDERPCRLEAGAPGSAGQRRHLRFAPVPSMASGEMPSWVQAESLRREAQRTTGRAAGVAGRGQRTDAEGATGEYHENTMRIRREYDANTGAPPQASGLHSACSTLSPPIQRRDTKSDIRAFLARLLVPRPRPGRSILYRPATIFFG